MITASVLKGLTSVKIPVFEGFYWEMSKSSNGGRFECPSSLLFIQASSAKTKFLILNRLLSHFIRNVMQKPKTNFRVIFVLTKFLERKFYMHCGSPQNAHLVTDHL